MLSDGPVQPVEAHFPRKIDDLHVFTDISLKAGRLRVWLETRRYDSVFISQEDNFACQRLGEDNRVLKNAEVGMDYLLITLERQCLFACSMYEDQILAEEVPGQDYKLDKVCRYEDEPWLKVPVLAGKWVATDTSISGVVGRSLVISQMHGSLISLELER